MSVGQQPGSTSPPAVLPCQPSQARQSVGLSDRQPSKLPLLFVPPVVIREERPPQALKAGSPII
eukprot:9230108-Heterocapsa_arctica.AAC.1